MKLIFQKSIPGRSGVCPEQGQHDATARIPDELLRQAPAALPELSELDVVRHFTGLSDRNFGVDSGFYPLGSCTMKYNPKFTEQAAGQSPFGAMHPQWAQVPGGQAWTAPALDVLADLSAQLCEICGMSALSAGPRRPLPASTSRRSPPPTRG